LRSACFTLRCHVALLLPPCASRAFVCMCCRLRRPLHWWRLPAEPLPYNSMTSNGVSPKTKKDVPAVRGFVVVRLSRSCRPSCVRVSVRLVPASCPCPFCVVLAKTAERGARSRVRRSKDPAEIHRRILPCLASSKSEERSEERGASTYIRRAILTTISILKRTGANRTGARSLRSQSYNRNTNRCAMCVM
jgi:hypothetical protein